MRCWIYPGQHGPLDAEHGIMNSCNVFFADMGHRLSMDENGTYSPELGIEKIRKYAAMFGLDETSGIEISEKSPQMTTEKPEASSIGQANHSYSNVQLVENEKQCSKFGSYMISLYYSDRNEREGI